MRLPYALLLGSAAALPEQIHIAYTGVPGTLSVDFVETKDRTWGYVETSCGGAPAVRSNTTSFYYDTIGQMHQGTLVFAGAAAGTACSYRAVTAAGASSSFSVTPIVSHPERFAIFGDFGLVNDIVMTDLTQQAAAGTFDSVLHVGDWAYDFEDLFSVQGNLFMNLVQGYAATHPVMPLEGNHEACTLCSPAGPFAGYNFTQYNARFHAVALGAGTNAGTGTARYYSFNQGLTHFVVFTAEAYLYARDDAFLENQLAFIRADLAAVDRKVTPWIVGLAHKDWTMASEAFGDIQPVFDQYKVDLLFCGHVHYYNRYAPYDSVTKQVDTASVSADGYTYTNPRFTVVIVTGASGDIEGDDKYVKESPSITGTENYGYGIFTAVNASYATWTFKTVKGSDNYADHLTIIKA